MRNRAVPAALAAILAVVVSVHPSPARAAGPAAPAGQAAAGGEAMELARQLGDAARRHDAAAVDGLVDVDTLFERTTAGINAPADFKATFEQGAKPQMHRLSETIAQEGAGYHFLRARQVNGQTRLLYRVLVPGSAGGLNYHDWVVGKGPQGRLRLQDLYTAGTGELLSQTLRRGYTQALLADHPGLMDRLSGKDKEFAASLDKMIQMTRDSQAGQYQQVVDAYEALPATTRKDKNLMLLRLMAAAHLRKQSPEEFKTATTDYMRTFPGDPSVDLLCVDGMVEMKQFDQARQSLDRLEAFTGGDPYLLFIRGNICKLEGGQDNLAKARQLYQKAIDAEPTLAQPYWALVTLSLEEKQYDQTAALLTQVQQKLHTNFKDLTKVPAYAGFVKSEAYRKWIAGQKPPAPGRGEQPAK